MRRIVRLAALTILGFILSMHCMRAVSAHESASDRNDRDAMHLTHPLFSESPSPDTKLRFDYFFKNLVGSEGRQHTLRLESEYAFSRSLSMEVDIPYSFLDPGGESSRNRLDTVEIGLKYAHYTLEDHNLLIGGGIDFSLPTGDGEKGIGSDHTLEIEPFLDFGYVLDRFEIVGFIRFGVPVNENGDNESDLELGWNLAAHCPLTARIAMLLELDGQHVFGGDEDGFDSVNLTPGVKLQPLDDPSLSIGAGVRFPLTHDKKFHALSILSVFYHFWALQAFEWADLRASG